jgi:hypothetical protein
LSGIAPVILLVLEDGKGRLRFFVHPDWRTIVQPGDLDYIESVLDDLRARAALDSDALFKQLSSLDVGPLVTLDSGTNIADHPAIRTMLPLFELL